MFKLVSAIKETLKKFVFLESDNDYMIVSFYIILSYLQDLVDTVPYLHVLAEPGADQSTLFKIVELLACKPLHAGWISDAALYRALDQHHGMYIWDQAEFKGLVLKIFLGGFNKKSGDFIVSDKSDPRKYNRYQVFGPKLTGGTRNISDPALRSHFIVIRMTPPDESKRPSKFFLTAQSQEITDIVNSLQKLQEEPFKQNFEKLYRNLGEFDGIRNGDRDLFDPLLPLAKMADEEEDIPIFLMSTLAFADRQIDERHEEDPFTHLPTIVINSVWTYVKPLLDKPAFAENRYFWAENMYKHVKKDLENLEYYVGKRYFEFDNVKDLGKILGDQGILLGPVKRKNKRVVPNEDETEASTPATHYQLNVGKLKKLADELPKKYQDPDIDKRADRGDL